MNSLSHRGGLRLVPVMMKSNTSRLTASQQSEAAVTL